MGNIGKVILAASILILFSCSNGPENKQKNEDSMAKKVEQAIPKFKIDFPETKFKVEKTETRDANFDNLLITNWILEGEDENGPFLYFVAQNEFPEKLKVLEKADPNSLNIALKTMLEGQATKLGGTGFEFTEIKYAGYPGMESICNVFNGNGILKSRVYKIDNNLFMMSAGGLKISVDSVDKFLNSFELVKQKP